MSFHVTVLSARGVALMDYKRKGERERTILTGQKHFNYSRLSKIGIKAEKTANWSMSTRNTETPTAKENCIHS